MSDDQADAELGVVPLKVTLKAGAGFEAPWLTVEADTTAELVAQLAACQADGVMEQITAASRALRSTFSAAPSESKAAPPPSNPETSTPSSSSSSGAAESTAENLSERSSSGSATESSSVANVTAEAADPIIAALDAATDLVALRKVYPAFKTKGWTDDHTKYATARAAELEKK